MPRGRKAGFKHSPETIEKMKGKRKLKEEKGEIVEEEVDVPEEREEEPIINI